MSAETDTEGSSDPRDYWPPGFQRPEGYVDWRDWAEAQKMHWLKQTQCPKCGLWNFPQEVCEHD